ncbi:MAG: HAMP domain-containing histidine kinase [Lachnospiraceae bacterium]|nr:HAMP domain-containing histidine kinase [Lachnospiraceae bacterium]
MDEMNQDINKDENDINKEMKINSEKDVNIEKSINAEKEAKKKKKENRRGMEGFLQFLQHLLITAAAVILLVVVSGSAIIVHDLYGNRRFSFTYTLVDIDPNKSYEDSDMFCSIFSKAVTDIIRFGVLRSQMETDGKFDSKKIIDVTAYNNRTSAMPEKYVTAEYYLGDLLKWENYGLTYDTYSDDSKELKNFLNNYTIVTMLERNIQSGISVDYYYMKTPEGIYTSNVSGNSLTMDTTTYGNADTTTNITSNSTDESVTVSEDHDILINKYKTVDGKNIEDYTAEWESYNKLCENVEKAMQDLSYNYDEYLAYGEYYDGYNTNIRYCLERTVGGHTEYFTNMIDDSVNSTKNEDPIDVAAFFSEVFDGKLNGKVSRYLYYNPDEMIYKSNSHIDEEMLRSILKDYSYAYPENIKLWIGVDSSYAANDALADGYKGFQNYVPYIWKWLVAAVAAIVLYLLIFIYLTVMTGRVKGKDGSVSIHLTEFDKMPTGAGIFFGAIAACVICMAFYVAMESLNLDLVNALWYRALMGTAVFIADMIFLFFYYSLVRRIKAKTLWKNSYMSRVLKKISKLVSELYGNSSIVVRTWVPYMLFLLFNLFMAVLTILISDFGISFLFIIMITIAVDAVVGMILYRDVKERQDIVNGIEKIATGDFSYQVEQEKVHGYNTALAKSVNSIGNGIKNAVESSMKDERMKTELITNVSHDIKTPLTSIINYVDLIKREEVDNERVRNYIRILDEKSQRLKQLTDDLVEASKISSGNISLNFERINMTELLNQTIGEFSEKFEKKNLSIVIDVKASNAVIEADSRRIWRIMENLFNNICKYALEGTRVYITVYPLKNKVVMKQEWVEISIKNISAAELNCNPEELTERFIRGDESRTTEGSGLGLSIAKNLTEAQKGTFNISLDGDLFKVVMTFPLIQE